MVTLETATEMETTPLQWGSDAPRGGQAVFRRILKDGSKVPLFLGQTLVHSLRDLGYNHTTSAVCEHVDNAMQWGATEIRVYFHQTGKRGNYQIDTLVFDNGSGMSPHTLKVAMAFGGSMLYQNRRGIGRYGMGMKAAALSMSPVMETYSWQEPGAIYTMTLDVNAIGNDRSNLIELPDPQLIDELPSEISRILSTHMTFPKPEAQALFARNSDQAVELLGKSGTIIYMPECDRLTYRKTQTLVEHATKEMARIYRRQLADGHVKLYVNNRRVEVVDPTPTVSPAKNSLEDFISKTYIDHSVLRDDCQEAKRGEAGGHRITRNGEALGVLLLTCATPALSLIALWCLIGATSRGQAWTPAGVLPHGRDGLSARRMAVWWMCREPSLGRHMHRELMRNAVLDLTPIISATACHQRNYVAKYSRYKGQAHLRYATAQQCAVVTANVRDFLRLHQTWQEEGRHHAGILALYRENNPQRDMTYAQIARAISQLEHAGLSLPNMFHNLNMWRESSRRS